MAPKRKRTSTLAESSSPEDTPSKRTRLQTQATAGADRDQGSLPSCLADRAFHMSSGTKAQGIHVDTAAIAHSPQAMQLSPFDISADDRSNATTDEDAVLSNSGNPSHRDYTPPQQHTLTAQGHDKQYQPPQRPLPANPKRPSTPVPGTAPKAALGTRLRRAADRVSSQNFRYESIRADQVRLLRLEKGQPTDPIQVALLTVQFQMLGGEYRFEALSYNWGVDVAAKPIFVQDLSRAPPKFTSMRQSVDLVRQREMWVKYNLYEALYHLRSPDQDLWLWVDALCIDQENSKEKEVQVARIADVYVAAENVLVWLGQGNKRTKRAIELLRQLAVVEEPSEIINKEERLQDWKDLAYLMKSTWFSRRWVIQELALSKNAVVYCGSDAIHWNNLRDGVSLFVEIEEQIRTRFRNSRDFNHDYHALEDPEPLAAKILVEKECDVFRKNARDGMHVATQGLEGLVSSLFAFNTSDPRDTINALLNISKEGIGLGDRMKATVNKRSKSMRQATAVLDEVQSCNSTHIAQEMHLGRNHPPVPSYRKDLLEVYIDFLNWIVDTTRSINILCRHWAIPEREQQVSGYPELVSLPSWIKLTSDGPFKHSEHSFHRQNADSLVGLPGESPYNACDQKTEADIEFHIQEASDLTTSASAPLNGRRSAWARVKGLRLGTIDRCTDAISGGNITMSALEMLGWKPGQSGEQNGELKDDIWRPLVVERGFDGKNPPPLWRKSCMDILSNHTENQSINIDMIMPKNKLPHTKKFLKRMRQVTWNRKFFELRLDEVYKSPSSAKEHCTGLGQPDTRRGDIVCVLYGCSVPCVLRPRPNEGGTERHYDFIGECYVYGFMGGEAITLLTAKKLEEQEKSFVLL